MVTKQQQLEWLAIQCDKWPSGMEYLLMSDLTVGLTGGDLKVTRQEWQQERDKMSSKPEADNSWYERGELPPVGCECEWVDDSWVDGADGVCYPDVGCVVFVCEHKETPGGDVIAVFTWPNGDGLGVAASRMPADFSPLRTEREKAIEDMSRVMHEHDSVINDDTLGALYDAGYRKVAP